MSKFKFGDKVWHEEYGNGVYGKSSDLKVTTLSQVMFESVGCINVPMSELTPATDWVKCSERMPEFNVRVLVVSGNWFRYDFLLNMDTHSEWASMESWEYWMYAPEMPEVEE